ncbi:rCG60691 [Rattus norvegicus]|uniref:RCG60691 n=1 Tax=Rattus norvegicus TaxID=10116 RepID=A6JJM0_RAT|nr:rCG60691 [Rattus norvegicus]
MDGALAKRDSHRTVPAALWPEWGPGAGAESSTSN